MTDDARERLIADLLVDEGVVLHAYTDSLGYLSLGCGRLIDKRRGGGITYVEAMMLLDNDIDRTIRDLVERFSWVTGLNPVRQVVLTELCFNLGIAGLSKFKNTLAAVERGDYNAAVIGLQNSLWYRQVGKSRSTRLIQMLRTGEWPDTQRA